ncbi:MAG: NAD(P)-dependent dehydrogenase (short-subunit alcohol dehydrogenase family) [Alphaproteobacteria bacterium]|jgi:NAD(P)-dependent dehydrogenase (short-subunit alcohol dehydrogenase family)
MNVGANDIVNLNGKVAIITGSANEAGIGLATAQLFAKSGANVAMLDLVANMPSEKAARLGGNARGFVCDVTDQRQCQDAVSQIVESMGRIDILINNAGTVFGTRFTDIKMDEYDTVMDVNLRGNFHMCQSVTPFLRQAGGGSIVCISSIAGQVGGGLFGSSHYAASKGGIFSLTKALARELAPENIRVNAIAPGVIDNNFTKGRMTREIKDEIAGKIPMGRLGVSGDIAKCCLFLASDLSSYVTGAVLDVNGGLHIH